MPGKKKASPTPQSYFKQSAGAYQQLAAFNGAAVGLTVPSGATYAVMQAEGGDVRWRDDGTSPTGTVGMLIASGSTLVYDGKLAGIKVIGAAAGSKLNVSYYRD